VAFVTSLGVHSNVFVTRLSNKAREALKNTFRILLLLVIVDVNTGIIFLKTYDIASV